jgi:hypothetical protein
MFDFPVDKFKPGMVSPAPQGRRGVKAPKLSTGVSRTSPWRANTSAPPQRACWAPAEAEKVLHDAGQSVCGSDKSEHRCPFYESCSYQRHKEEVAEADVVIAANVMLFRALPERIKDDLGLVIIDEAFWQQGLKPNRDMAAAASHISLVFSQKRNRNRSRRCPTSPPSGVAGKARRRCACSRVLMPDAGADRRPYGMLPQERGPIV